MTLAHHNAPHRDQWRGSKTPFLSTEQAGNGNVSSRSELAISLYNDSAAQVVQHQCLMGLGQTKLPRQASILDAGPPGRTSTTVVAGIQKMAFATPEATIPTPTSETSLTETRARGFEHFKS